MSKNTIYILDVFAKEKYQGNQLAVVKVNSNISDKEMLEIAKEINFSETTFITNDEKINGGYNVRIFTPKEEVPFAGHPTIGTAYIIKNEIIKDSVSELILNLKVGQIPVKFSNDKNEQVIWMKQNQPEFYNVFDTNVMAEIISIDEKDIDKRYPIQEVSTGLSHIIVPLKSLDAVRRVKVNKEMYFKLIENLQAKSILVFCPETYNKENDINVRVFGDYYGVPEDAATGSGNGCLAGYLVKHQYFGNGKIDIRSEQGYEMGRPSLLYLKAEEQNGDIEINVGGNAILISKGELML